MLGAIGSKGSREPSGSSRLKHRASLQLPAPVAGHGTRRRRDSATVAGNFASAAAGISCPRRRRHRGRRARPLGPMVEAGMALSPLRKHWGPNASSGVVGGIHCTRSERTLRHRRQRTSCTGSQSMGSVNTGCRPRPVTEPSWASPRMAFGACAASASLGDNRGTMPPFSSIPGVIRLRPSLTCPIRRRRTEDR